MVKLHIKKGDESQFLYETTVEQPIDDLLKDVSAIYNGRLKVQRVCAEIECLAEHGITLPPNMQGLTDEQVVDLKLKDEWADRCTPQGGVRENPDKVGVRNGQAPTTKMAEVLTKTVKEAKDMISKKKVQADQMVTQATVKEALDILRGAVTIVYPMGLPPHDNIRLEFENNEDLSGTQASLEIIEDQNASVWFSGKEMLRGKTLKDYVGKNEKTKIIAKLQKKGQGCPSREPVVSEDEQKQMMAYYYKKQEDMKEWIHLEGQKCFYYSGQLGSTLKRKNLLLWSKFFLFREDPNFKANKKLEKEAEDSYLDSAWADNSALKKSFHGLKDIKWGPR